MTGYRKSPRRLSALELGIGGRASLIEYINAESAVTQPPSMQPKYISPELFHFFGSPAPLDHERNYALLKKVLSTGCISHPPHEVGWGTIGYSLDFSKTLAREDMLIPHVTCYCDIPYDQLGPHLLKYGRFGLSFSRHQLTKVGARPVIYVPCRPDDWQGVFTGHTLLRELKATFHGVHAQRVAVTPNGSEVERSVALGKPPETVLEALEKAEHTLALRVLAFVKPYESTLDESDPDYRYSEREWRKLGNFLFESNDVIRIVVERSFLERAKEELPNFGGQLCPAPE